jgi:hypothetical protein
MKSEEIIMLVFVAAITVGIPILMYIANKEEKES